MLKNECRSCLSKNLLPVLDLGDSPLANNLLDKVQECVTYPLEMMLCMSCYNCQLTYVVDPDEMFKDYLYASSTTESFKRHFEDAAKLYIKEFNLTSNSMVVDIGSNDGIALRPLKDRGIKVLGIEPAQNICDIAVDNGIDTYCGYFDNIAIGEIKQKVDLVTMSNVFAHLDDIESLTHNVFKILKRNGVFIIEVHYLLRTIEDETFDNIYHEHVNYWSIISLHTFFQRLGYQIFNVEEINTHGGSIRVYISNHAHKVNDKVKEFYKKERKILDNVYTWREFRHNVKTRKSILVDKLNNIKGKIIGYGAPAKATTLLNYFGIDNSILSCTVDDNPLKQGKIIPKVNVPIISKEDIPEDTKYILILAWNFSDIIIENNKDLLDKGITFIVPGKELKIVGKE